MKNTKRVKDLTGLRFGRLTVIGLQPNETRRSYWVCSCDCGGTKVVRSDALQSGRTVSCGCKKREQDKKNLSSGYSARVFKERGFVSGHTRLYGIWQNMRKRCNNENDARYSSYGGRGIKVCDEWDNDYLAFHNWAIENGYGENLTIDRIDNDGNYCPENCRWTTNKEQCNNRRSNIRIKIGNSERTLTEWCDIFCVDSNKIFERYYRNGFTGIDDLFNE
jgi:hypothetical protein